MLRTEKFSATFWRPSDMGEKIQTFQASLLERIYIQLLNKSSPKIAQHLLGRSQDCRFVYDEFNHQINLHNFSCRNDLLKNQERTLFRSILNYHLIVLLQSLYNRHLVILESLVGSIMNSRHSLENPKMINHTKEIQLGKKNQ